MVSVSSVVVRIWERLVGLRFGEDLVCTVADAVWTSTSAFGTARRRERWRRWTDGVGGRGPRPRGVVIIVIAEVYM